MPFVSALPLRLPLPQNDMAGMLASWMDNSPGLGLSSVDCQSDLEKIDRLRRDIAQRIGERGPSGSVTISEESQKEITTKLHEYYHLLLECEKHGMVQQSEGRAGPPSSDFVSLEWESAILTSESVKIQTANSLESERANVMWNLATLEAHQASKNNLTIRNGWNKASKCLQNAASWLGHLLVLLQEQELKWQLTRYSDMSTNFVLFWQALVLAQAQHCIYKSITCAKRPIAAAAAKLAAATGPLYGEVEMIAQNDENSPHATPALSQCSELVSKWALFARAWGAYMNCKAEYHESQIHQQKKAWGQELARLDVASQHAAVCKNLCEEESSSSATPPQAQIQVLEELRIAVDETLKVLLSRVDIAERENTDKHKQPVPAQNELTEIRGQKLVKSNTPLSELLREKTTEAIFQTKSSSTPPSARASIVHTGNNNYNHVAKNTMLPKESNPPFSSSSSSFSDQKKLASPSDILSPNLEAYAAVFQAEMNDNISDLARATEDMTESARLALAEVNLPHSLTAYKQEQSGGGLPEELWHRVSLVQQDNKINQLKQDLWELKDASDLARLTHEKITSQLDFDTTSDQNFREANPDFEGHNVEELQISFRRILSNYNKLLSSAQEGDSVLFRRLEQLDIEPKYNLLQFSKSQLDRLLPGARGRNSGMVIDTQHLSYLLGELSALFQERANLMALIRKEFRTFDILRALRERVDTTKGTDKDYLEATKHAQKAFDGMRYEIENNMTSQNELLGTILIENEEFMNSRERTTNSQSADSCIVMIEDAIEETGQLSNHSKEGKDFYNVLIPKLSELKHQVDDVSARLTVERLEYSERERKVSQERKDALMAKKMFSNESKSSPADSTTEGSAAATTPAAAATSTPNPAAAGGSPPRSTNGVSSAATASHHSTQAINRIDDEKVATLVAMEFDAEKVVAALEKHDNDIEKALNELIDESLG